MKYFFYLILISSFSCGSNEVENVDTAENKIISDRIFMNANLKIKEIDEQSSCNRLVKHYIATSFTNNIDTLKKCALILTDSIFNDVPYNNCGKIMPRCGVFLYTSKENFNITANFAACSKNLGKESSVIMSDYNLK